MSENNIVEPSSEPMATDTDEGLRLRAVVIPPLAKAEGPSDRIFMEVEKLTDTYTQLIELLDQREAHYRLIDHESEGRTELVSAMRGNRLEQAAKCLILMVKIGKKVTKYVLAVIPGDAKVDLQAVKALLHGTYISFASTEIAERLAGSVAGTVLPFTFHPDLELIVDPSLLENDELYFNAARLDRSLVLKTSDYRAVARPRLELIVSQEP